MLAFIVLGALNGVLQSFLSNSISQSIMFDQRRRLYGHLSRMSLSWFTSNRTGETLSRISNDVSGIQGVISDTMGSVAGNLITLTSGAIDYQAAKSSVSRSRGPC